MMSELDGYGVLRALQTDAKLALIPFILLLFEGVLLFVLIGTRAS
jgi:hypothetical protein